MRDDVILSASDDTTSSTVAIAVHAGGRLRQVTTSSRGTVVTLLADSVADAPAHSTGWGSFPMAPWAGRLRNGRFVVHGTPVQLDLNHRDGDGDGGGTIWPPKPASHVDLLGVDRGSHAIHGTTFARRWTVDELDEDGCTLSCALDGALGWTDSGFARQQIRLRPRRLDLELVVEASPGIEFPAAIGWHPWFVKPASLGFAPTSMYTRDDVGVATGQVVAPTPPPWDDCFVNHEPVHLRYDRTVASVVTVTSDCDHWVVYDHPAHATCVEPQSGPPDAFNLAPRIVDIENPLRRTMTITW